MVVISRLVDYYRSKRIDDYGIRICDYELWEIVNISFYWSKKKKKKKLFFWVLGLKIGVECYK